MSEAYHDAVARLLTLGDPRRQREWPQWPDYPALRLAAGHIPELARMALDEDLHWAGSESAAVWAPLHAWRALAQLRAEEAVEPLTRLLSRIDEFNDDWVREELPDVFGMIGPGELPVLVAFGDAEEHSFRAMQKDTWR